MTVAIFSVYAALLVVELSKSAFNVIIHYEILCIAYAQKILMHVASKLVKCRAVKLTH